jgi:hypothetical protein
VFFKKFGQMRNQRQHAFARTSLLGIARGQQFCNSMFLS